MSLLSRLVARNWTLKISALALALLLWVSVRVESPDRHDLPDIPVRIDLTDPDWTLAGDPLPGHVRVRFSGPSRELFRMAMERPNIVIPVGEVHREDTTVVLRGQWVRVQDRPGVVVEDIQPSSVRLSFEPLERRTLPVALRVTGSLPSGLAIAGEPVVEPEEVRVTGPRGRVEPLDSIPLEGVDLREVTSSDFVTVPLDTAGLRGLQVVPSRVSLSFRVEAEVERVVAGIPVVVRPENLEEEVEVSPSTLTVRIIGARSLVERLDPTTLRMAVRVAEPPEEETPHAVSLEGLPSLLRGIPSRETVIVRAAGAE